MNLYREKEIQKKKSIKQAIISPMHYTIGAKKDNTISQRHIRSMKTLEKCLTQQSVNTQQENSETDSFNQSTHDSNDHSKMIQTKTCNLKNLFTLVEASDDQFMSDKPQPNRRSTSELEVLDDDAFIFSKNTVNNDQQFKQLKRFLQKQCFINQSDISILDKRIQQIYRKFKQQICNIKELKLIQVNMMHEGFEQLQ